jgi:hypothetical protein
MKYSIVFAALSVSGALMLAELAACSNSGNGSTGPSDASLDVIAADTATDGGEAGATDAGCTGVMCNGECIPSGDCHGCSGAPFLCASTGQCAAGCQACSSLKGVAMPIECFACDINHQNPIGTCQQDDAGAYCLSGDYLGQYDGGPGYQCQCGNVSDCPGATQVCVPLGNVDASFCLTCGEATIGPIDGGACRDGGACQENLGRCQ